MTNEHRKVYSIVPTKIQITTVRYLFTHVKTQTYRKVKLHAAFYSITAFRIDYTLITNLMH